MKKSEEWMKSYPGAAVGMLVLHGVTNVERHEGLDALKVRLEAELRSRFAGDGIEAMRRDPTLQADKSYYKRFGKTYHVAQQLESVVIKGRHLPFANALVEAMFMAELRNLLLTAGHDLGTLIPPFEIGTATGSERFMTMRGEEHGLKQGDMMIADSRGALSSIISGPDERSKITLTTRDVVFFAYAPAGIGEEKVRFHLENIRRNVIVFSPGVETEPLETIVAE